MMIRWIIRADDDQGATSAANRVPEGAPFLFEVSFELVLEVSPFIKFLLRN